MSTPRQTGPTDLPLDQDALDHRIETVPVEDDSVRSQLVAKVRPPPAKAPITVTQHAGPITGERVVWQSPKGWHFDIRATSEPYPDEDGDNDALMVDIVAEVLWYRGQLLGEPLSPVVVFAHTVFLERPPSG